MGTSIDIESKIIVVQKLQDFKNLISHKFKQFIWLDLFCTNNSLSILAYWFDNIVEFIFESLDEPIINDIRVGFDDIAYDIGILR
jgi:hypothetical protein